MEQIFTIAIVPNSIFKIVIFNKHLAFEGGMNNKMCVVHNGLIEGKWRIGEVESKIMAGIIAQIGIDDTEFKPMRFAYEDFFSIIGHSEKSKNHVRIREHLQSLQSKICSIKKTDGYFLDTQWLGECEYFETEVLISIPPKFGPYLLELKKDFTKFFLKDATRLKGAYSLQIYLLAKQYLSIGSRIITIDDLRKKLDIKDKYPSFKNLRVRVIEPSVKSINESSDIHLTVTPMKESSKAFKKLLFEVKKQQPEPEILKHRSKMLPIPAPIPENEKMSDEELADLVSKFTKRKS